MNSTKTILACAATAAIAAGAETDVDTNGSEPSAETSRSSVTQADLDASPWLKMAQGETDTGVVVSYERCQDFRHEILRKSRRHLHLLQA